MKFIRPTTITDALLVSSSELEADYDEWNAATSYLVGDRVIRASTHRIYESLIAGVNATTPESAPTRWTEIAPTNKWAMFDSQVGTATTAADSLTVVLSPGRFNSLALLQVDAATVDISFVVDSVEVYAASMNLNNGNTVGNWYQYFYEPVYQQDTLVITDLVDAALLDLPAYGTGTLTVTLTRTGGTVSCGVLVVGMYASLGETQYRPTIGITDYSRKDIDTFGNPTVTLRKYSKRMTTNVTVQRDYVDQVARILAQYRSALVVWVGSGSIYTSMIIYGFYKDWSITIEDYSTSNLSLEVEGMV